MHFTEYLEQQNQLLQAKILEFYTILNDIDEYYGVVNDINNDYKEHFNIETKRHGEIKNNQ